MSAPYRNGFPANLGASIPATFRPPGPVAAQKAVPLAGRLPQEIQRFTAGDLVQYLTYLGQFRIPATLNVQAFSGTALGTSADYVLFYENNTQWPQSFRAAADPLVATTRVNFTRAKNIDSFVDFLAQTGAVRGETDQILVMPGDKIYISNQNPAIALDASDVIRKKVTDLRNLLDPQRWPGLVG